jgi:hypothetical protein
VATTTTAQRSQLLEVYRRFMTMDSTSYTGTAGWPLKVRAVIIHTLKDPTELYPQLGDASSVEDSYGLLTDWTTPKPAVCACVALNPAGTAARTFPGC